MPQLMTAMLPLHQWYEIVTGKPAFWRAARNDTHDSPTWLPLGHESTLSMGNTPMADSPSRDNKERDIPSIRSPMDTRRVLTWLNGLRNSRHPSWMANPS